MVTFKPAILPRRRTPLASSTLAAWVATVATGETVQNFDDVPKMGTTYCADRHIPGCPPCPLLMKGCGPCPTLIDGGPIGDGEFIRLAFEDPIPPSHTSISFDRCDIGAFDLVVADFDFRITPGFGRADGFGFALLNTVVPGFGIKGCVAPLSVGEEPNFEESLGIGFDIHQATDGMAGIRVPPPIMSRRLKSMDSSDCCL